MLTQCLATKKYEILTSPPPPYQYGVYFSQSDYSNNNNLPNNSILDINISLTPKPYPEIGYTTRIYIGVTGINYPFVFDNNGGGEIVQPSKCIKYEFIGNSENVCPNSPIPVTNGLVRATIINNCPNLPGFTVGNIYEIDINYCNNGEFSASILYLAEKQFTVSSNDELLCIGCNCLKTTDKFQVPQIQIIAQTTIEGTDIGEAIFIICDKYTYYKCGIPHNTCKTRYINNDDVKQTKINRCCPYMVSVVKGKGETLTDKVTYLYNKNNVNIPFNDFYGDIILYGMTRYVLAKLLWGRFNIQYLLNKYSKEFFHDLAHSRFCNFIEFFQTVVSGYEKYFKYDNYITIDK